VDFTLHKKLLNSIAYLHNGKYAIAVSGGSDSLALLYLCHELGLADKCIVVHFDHNVRDESSNEADFVEQTSKKLGFKFVKHVWSPKKEGNFYQTARKARYSFFNQVVSDNNLNGILVAHSKTDLAETFLMRVTKGASLKGISIFEQGTKIFGVKVYRPLLDFSRQDLQDYLLANNIDWMKDPSNLDENKMRPRIRAILPKLEDIGLSMQGLKEAVSYFNQANNAIDHYTKQELSKFTNLNNLQAYYINASNFFELPIEIQIRLINYIINKFSKDFKHNPRRKNLLAMLNRLKQSSKVEHVDCISIEIIEDKLFVYSTEFSYSTLDNNLTYLQDFDKKTRYNIIKHNNLQFLPISIRNRVRISMPNNKATNHPKVHDFTCHID
jgi:tRNA(Ile)-lysidine synthase